MPRSPLRSTAVAPPGYARTHFDAIPFVKLDASDISKDER